LDQEDILINTCNIQKAICCKVLPNCKICHDFQKKYENMTIQANIADWAFSLKYPKKTIYLFPSSPSNAKMKD